MLTTHARPRADRGQRGMTLLEILKQKQSISDNQYAEFEETGNKVAAMLGGLIKSIYKPKEDGESKKVGT